MLKILYGTFSRGGGGWFYLGTTALATKEHQVFAQANTRVNKLLLEIFAQKIFWRTKHGGKYF